MIAVVSDQFGRREGLSAQTDLISDAEPCPAIALISCKLDLQPLVTTLVTDSIALSIYLDTKKNVTLL
jgi:hypothetical protein